MSRYSCKAGRILNFLFRGEVDFLRLDGQLLAVKIFFKGVFILGIEICQISCFNLQAHL